MEVWLSSQAKKALQERQTQLYPMSKRQDDLLPTPAWQWQTQAPKLPT